MFVSWLDFTLFKPLYVSPQLFRHFFINYNLILQDKKFLLCAITCQCIANVVLGVGPFQGSARAPILPPSTQQQRNENDVTLHQF